MGQWINEIPFIWRVKSAVRAAERTYHRRYGPSKLRKRLAANPRRRIVIGAANKYDHGWIPTERQYFDVIKPDDWARYFEPNSIEAILAEHVWEHLTAEQGFTAAGTCFTYLRPGGYLRVAVPDGFHPDPTYLEWVKVGGAGPGQIANGHKILYTYRALTELFERSRFRVKLYEYFDESGTFHYHEWNPEGGTILRSKRFDPRNKTGTLRYTSIMFDAFKE